MKIFKIIIAFVLLIGLVSVVVFCSRNNNSKNNEDTKTLNYNNITIYSDLSNRLSKSPNDRVVINQLKDYFVKECVKPGQKVNDCSSLAYSRMNSYNSNCSSFTIDIETVGNVTEKAKFVNNKGSGITLNKALSSLDSVVDCSYKETDSIGLDILSLLYNEINDGRPIKQNRSVFNGSDSTLFQFNNHVFIFTDGYLEFSRSHGNLNLYFGRPEIDRVRALCQQKKQTPLQVLSSCPNLRLMPLQSENNKLVNLYVMETDDRGLNVQTGTLRYTGELSDNHILKTVWELWAAESGFRQFSWKTATKGNQLPANYIKSMIQSALSAEALKLPSGFITYDHSGSDCNPVSTELATKPALPTTTQSTIKVGEPKKGAPRAIPNTIQIIPIEHPINSSVYRATTLRTLGASSSAGLQLKVGAFIKVLACGVDNKTIYWKVQSGNQVGFLEKNEIYINEDLRDFLKKNNL